MDKYTREAWVQFLESLGKELEKDWRRISDSNALKKFMLSYIELWVLLSQRALDVQESLRLWASIQATWWNLSDIIRITTQKYTPDLAKGLIDSMVSLAGELWFQLPEMYKSEISESLSTSDNAPSQAQIIKRIESLNYIGNCFEVYCTNMDLPNLKAATSLQDWFNRFGVQIGNVYSIEDKINVWLNESNKYSSKTTAIPQLNNKISQFLPDSLLNNFILHFKLATGSNSTTLQADKMATTKRSIVLSGTEKETIKGNFEWDITLSWSSKLIIEWTYNSGVDWEWDKNEVELKQKAFLKIWAIDNNTKIIADIEENTGMQVESNKGTMRVYYSWDATLIVENAVIMSYGSIGTTNVSGQKVTIDKDKVIIEYVWVGKEKVIDKRWTAKSIETESNAGSSWSTGIHGNNILSWNTFNVSWHLKIWDNHPSSTWDIHIGDFNMDSGMDNVAWSISSKWVNISGAGVTIDWLTPREFIWRGDVYISKVDYGAVKKYIEERKWGLYTSNQLSGWSPINGVKCNLVATYRHQKSNTEIQVIDLVDKDITTYQAICIKKNWQRKAIIAQSPEQLSVKWDLHSSQRWRSIIWDISSFVGF